MKQITSQSILKKHGMLAAAVLFFMLALQFHRSFEIPPVQISKQDSALTFNSSFLRFTSLGNKRVYSNLLWISTLLESDHDKYVRGEAQDWMYLRFLAISSLDPLFYENYLFGGMYLSTIKDDLEGAATIFDLGLKYYPDDYKLNYYSGFNYFFEMGNMEKGYERLNKIKNDPRSPPVLRNVIAKLQFEVTKDYDLALAFLKMNWELAKDEKLKKKLEGDMYALVAQRDLECLNGNNINCRRADLYGVPYYQDKHSIWHSQRSFKPYQIFKKVPSAND